MAAINTRGIISFAMLVIVLFTGCKAYQSNQMQSQIAGLQDQIRKMKEDYKPGFGDLMGIIQTHHAKLWYAGTNQNWKLAEFEIHEIEETFEKISELHGDRYNASQLIPAFILPFLESTEKAARSKDIMAFKDRYAQLTTGCNNCHANAGFGFIVIQTPTEPAFTNQDFKIGN